MKIFLSVLIALGLLSADAHAFELRNATEEELLQASQSCLPSNLSTLTLVSGDLSRAIDSLGQSHELNIRMLLLTNVIKQYFFGPPPAVQLTGNDRVELCGISLFEVSHDNSTQSPLCDRPVISAKNPPEGPTLGMDVVTVSGNSQLSLQNLVIDAFFWGSHCAVIAIKQSGHLFLIQSSIIRFNASESVYGVYSTIYMGKHGDGTPTLTVEGDTSVLTGTEPNVITASNSELFFHGGILTLPLFNSMHVMDSVLTFNGTMILACPGFDSHPDQSLNLDQVLPFSSRGAEGCLNLNKWDCKPPGGIYSANMVNFLNARNTRILMVNTVLTGRIWFSNFPAHAFFSFNNVTVNPQSRNNLFFSYRDTTAQSPSNIIYDEAGQGEVLLNQLFGSPESVNYTVCDKSPAVCMAPVDPTETPFITETPAETLFFTEIPDSTGTPFPKQPDENTAVIIGATSAGITTVIVTASMIVVSLLVYHRHKHLNHSAPVDNSVALPPITDASQ